eukprot:3944192-Heterocapsa_arctica.AAC.1
MNRPASWKTASPSVSVPHVGCWPRDRRTSDPAVRESHISDQRGTGGRTRPGWRTLRKADP